ncbi:hypothetical protein MTBSS4_10026 [Magnetospirillum sp. SS-4]|nr:hypothetical protein MTBSS4_10026 [Magnetospirillum sp. SS-4]
MVDSSYDDLTLTIRHIHDLLYIKRMSASKARTLEGWDGTGKGGDGDCPPSGRPAGAVLEDGTRPMRAAGEAGAPHGGG